MCTLTLMWRVFPETPIAIAANRDENPLRPWSEPHAWEGIFAGRDEVAGGTWLGVSDGGLVCGITNRWGPANDPNPASLRPALASRGRLVVDALHCRSAEAAARELTSRRPDETNAYGLLVADEKSAFRVDCNGVSLTMQPLSPGIIVLANWSAEEKRPRSERATQLARAAQKDSFAAAVPSLRALVADHEGASELGRAICVHGDRYATVCSTLVGIGVERHFSDTHGNPCTSPWIVR